MKYIITGSIGHISRLIVEGLVSAGHDVSVITSDQGKSGEITKLGAKALVGSVTDRHFIVDAFKGADAVYLMIPPNFTADDFPAYQRAVADNYREGVDKNGIKHVVVLSSIGAHIGQGTGPIDGVAYLEKQLQPLNINAKYLRPSYFYSNLLSTIGMLKNANIIGSNFGDTDEKIVLTDYHDIAEKAVKFLKDLDFKGHSVEYISSDERTPSDIAKVLGNAVGKANVPWVTFSDEQALEGLLQAGIKPSLAEAFKTMGAAIRSGKVQEDYWKKNKQVSGKVKLETFAQTFAQAFNNSAS